MLLLFVALAVFVAWSWLSYPAVGHWLYDLNMAIEAKLYKLHKIEVPIAEMTVSTWQGGPYEAASAILMLHGYSADKNLWLRFSRHFVRQYRVIIPDLAGHGEAVVDVVDQWEHQPAEAHFGAHGQAGATGQEGMAAVLGTHTTLGQHAGAVGEPAGLADQGERRHVIGISARLRVQGAGLRVVHAGVHVRHQHRQAQAQVAAFLAQTQRGRVVHQGGVAVFMGKRGATHASGLGAVGFQIHAVGGGGGQGRLTGEGWPAATPLTNPPIHR